MLPNRIHWYRKKITIAEISKDTVVSNYRINTLAHNFIKVSLVYGSPREEIAAISFLLAAHYGSLTHFKVGYTRRAISGCSLPASRPVTYPE